MEKLSPRSYVTGGFDILMPPLIEYIGKRLQKTGKTWWSNCVYKKSDRIFGKDSDFSIPREGNIAKLRDLFDEYYFLKMCKLNKNVFCSLTSNRLPKLLDDLLEIRNKWAHSPGKGMNESEAIGAFSIMIELMGDISPQVVAKLKDLKAQMQSDYIDTRRKVLAPRETLILFLNTRVLRPLESSSIDEINRIVNDSRKLLEQTETAEDVVNFFWDAINKKGLKSYNIIKQHGFMTFEDIRCEFIGVCYGEYDAIT